MQENDQNVRIRKATIQDAALLTQIEAACFPAAEAATRDRFDARLAAFADHFLICEVDGQAVGFVDGMVIDSPYIEDVMYEKPICTVLTVHGRAFSGSIRYPSIAVTAMRRS